MESLDADDDDATLGGIEPPSTTMVGHTNSVVLARTVAAPWARVVAGDAVAAVCSEAALLAPVAKALADCACSTGATVVAASDEACVAAKSLDADGFDSDTSTSAGVFVAKTTGVGGCVGRSINAGAALDCDIGAAATVATGTGGCAP